MEVARIKMDSNNSMYAYQTCGKPFARPLLAAALVYT